MFGFRSQSGFGIVGVIFAAGLVAIAAMFVANFVQQQNTQGQRAGLSSSCDSIANSVVEYIKKDEASLFISSYGPQPGSTRYPAGLDFTDDGLDRFRLGTDLAPQFMGPTGFRMNLASTTRQLPPDWKYFNHLNIKNSSNRLTLLATSGDFCCESLDMNDPNCGSRFIGDNVTRPGFSLSQQNVEIDLAINFPSEAGGSLCDGRKRLSLVGGAIPDSTHSLPIHFKVKVTTGANTPNEYTCTASGQVQTSQDMTGALTLLEMQEQDVLCASGKQGLPSHCSSGRPVSFKVKTVKNSSPNSCLTDCLAAIQSRTCNSLESLNIFNTFSHGTCTSACLDSEPGSAFLCKIGEKNWFNNPANTNVWEPCELTRVYDFDGSVAGTVQIAYTPVSDNSTTEVTTNATITLSNLKQNRAYVVDVRSVDTHGNVGPSFCSVSPNSCETISLPHFAVLPSAPIVGQMTEISQRVAQVTSVNQRGRDHTITSQSKYSNALAPLGTNYYQCERGGVSYSVNISGSTPSGAFGVTSSYCSGTLTLPSGAIHEIPPGAGFPGCVCEGDTCIAQVAPVNDAGAYQFEMRVQNDCGGGVGEIRTQNWCLDPTPTVNSFSTGNKSFGAEPDFSGHITYPPSAQKACGRVTLCPTVTGGFIPTLGYCRNDMLGWSPLLHSGCVEDPRGNHCALVIDPCGRFKNTGPSKYSTTLMGTPHTGASVTNFCFSYGGNPVGGNRCSSGAYCSDQGKCLTSCEEPPCPNNIMTPSSTNCGPKYCPVLNSCSISIGSTPTGGPACVAASP